MLTIEEKIFDRGFVIFWSQRDIDLKRKKIIAVREKDPDGDAIVEQREFDDAELERILKINFTLDNEKTVRKVVPAGKFNCLRYTGIYDGGLIVVYYSDQVPLYPVKIAVHRYDKEIELIEYGKGAVSEFTPRAQQNELDKPGDKNGVARTTCPKVRCGQ